MSVQDAEPGDIYVDPAGKLWRVVGIFREPTADLVAIEETRMIAPVVETKERMFGGVSGLMWEGFKRIHRGGLAAGAGAAPVSDLDKAIEASVWVAKDDGSMSVTMPLPLKFNLYDVHLALEKRAYRANPAAGGWRVVGKEDDNTIKELVGDWPSPLAKFHLTR